MIYLVNITTRAQRDLADLYRRTHAESSRAASEWYAWLKEVILSLEQHPSRGPVFRKRNKLRHLLYAEKPRVFRVIYRGLEKRKQVEVLHIGQGARRKPKPGDLC